MSDRLRKAARAVIERWDSIHWKEGVHTGELIQELRQALAEETATADAPEGE